MKDNELFYTYINIKNNPTKIVDKNRGNYIYGREEYIRRFRNKKNGQEYI